MGYKLAGYDVLGCCEIDASIIEVYKANHKPKYAFNCDIRDFLKQDIPPELYDLDILDGSPPCSTFSMAGNREKDWGKEKVFAEGQKKQTLDDLFFYFIDIANELKPKIVISENVKGIILGNSKGYVKEIIRRFDNAGYDTQLFLINGAALGLPQRRERVFFVSRRKDLGLPKIKLSFKEKPISLGEATADLTEAETLGKKLSDYMSAIWRNCPCGKSLSFVKGKGHLFNLYRLSSKRPMSTITTRAHLLFHWNYPNQLSDKVIIRCSSFPEDYNFGKARVNFICGMSVPPVIMANIANEVYKQLLCEVANG